MTVGKIFVGTTKAVVSAGGNAAKRIATGNVEALVGRGDIRALTTGMGIGLPEAAANVYKQGTFDSFDSLVRLRKLFPTGSKMSHEEQALVKVRNQIRKAYGAVRQGWANPNGPNLEAIRSGNDRAFALHDYLRSLIKK